MQKLEMTSFPTPKRPVPIKFSLKDNNTLPEKIPQIVNKGNQDSTTYINNALGMRASYRVVYIREDIDSEFFTYDLLLLIKSFVQLILNNQFLY